MPEHINYRYLLKEPLGAGGMGVVYRAFDRLTRETVALKQVQLSPDQLQYMSRSPSMELHDLRLSLTREFQTLASLRHPHIISVLDYGFDDSQRPYYTMTYLPEALNISTAGRALSQLEKLALVQQVLQALTYLHRRGIYHRDLKPDNILVTRGHVRVMDFGLAMARSDEATSSSGGTLAYWAPELWMGEPFTEAADLFAVGVIAFELLANSHPFAPIDSFLLDRVLDDEPPWEQLEAAPAITTLIRKLLAKSPRDRYQDSGEVLRDLHNALEWSIPRETTAIRESYLQAATFVGRETELTHLHQALLQSQEGQSAIWLIGGESGVGKSRLADEVRIQAMIQGHQVLRGQAVDGGGLSFQVWKEPVRRLLLMKEPTPLEASVLKEIVPDISRLLGYDVSDPPELQGEAYQQRMALTIVSLFRGSAQPILLLLEDLQWAHEGLMVLKQMARVLSRLTGILVIGTYRLDEYPQLASEIPQAHDLPLNRLPDNDIVALSQAILGQERSDSQLVALLTRETEGNTFFIVEVMRALAEDAGRLDNVGMQALPTAVFTSGMHQLLQRRIQKVTAVDQPLLCLAAVAGRQLDTPLLAALAPEVELERWLTRISATTIFTVRDEQWVFAHDKLREAILTDLTANDRRALHEQVAEGLESVYPENESYFEKLLFHWHRANNLDRELVYLPPVAKHLIEYAGDYNQARDLLKRGRQQLAEDDQRQISLLSLEADSYQRQGDFDQSKALAKRVQALATPISDQAGLAHSFHLLAVAARNAGDYEQAVHNSQQSLTFAQAIGDWATAANTLKNLGGAARDKGHYDEAVAHFEQSLAIAQEMGNQSSVAKTLSDLGIIAHQRGWPDKAREYFEKGITVAQEAGGRPDMIRTLSILGLLAYNQGNFEASRRYGEQSISVAQEIGDQDGLGKAFYNMGLVVFKQGDFNNAHPYFVQGLEIMRTIGDRTMEAHAVANLGRVAYVRREYEQAKRHYQDSLSIARANGDRVAEGLTLNKLGALALAQFDYASAQTLYEQALAIRIELNQPHFVLEDYAGVALAAWRGGAPELASKYATQLLDLWPRNRLLIGSESPIQTLHFMWQVCQGLGLSEADDVLRTALQLMKTVLGHQPNLEMQTMYLQQMHHRPLWEAGGSSR